MPSVGLFFDALPRRSEAFGEGFIGEGIFGIGKVAVAVGEDDGFDFGLALHFLHEGDERSGGVEVVAEVVFGNDGIRTARGTLAGGKHVGPLDGRREGNEGISDRDRVRIFGIEIFYRDLRRLLDRRVAKQEMVGKRGNRAGGKDEEDRKSPDRPRGKAPQRSSHPEQPRGNDHAKISRLPHWRRVEIAPDTIMPDRRFGNPREGQPERGEEMIQRATHHQRFWVTEAARSGEPPDPTPRNQANQKNDKERYRDKKLRMHKIRPGAGGDMLVKIEPNEEKPHIDSRPIIGVELGGIGGRVGGGDGVHHLIGGLQRVVIGIDRPEVSQKMSAGKADDGFP